MSPLTAEWLPSRNWRAAYPLKDDPLQALSGEQRHKLEQLQRMLQSEKLWDADKHDLYMLRRFIKARDWDIGRAKQMWQEMLAFRANNRVDQIFEEFHFKEHAAVVSVYPHGLHKLDVEGRPVLVYRFGCVDLEALDKLTTSQRLSMWHIQEYERIMNMVLPACSVLAGRHIEKLVTLIDVAGVRMRDIGRILDMLSGFVKIDGNNYPETLGAMIIINAPMWFSGSFALIKRALSAETQKKVQILGSSYQSALYQAIPRENLLPEFGGTSSGPLGDAIGPWYTTLEQMRLAAPPVPHAPHKHKHDEMVGRGEQQDDGHVKRQRSIERGNRHGTDAAPVSQRVSAEHVIVLHPPGHDEVQQEQQQEQGALDRRSLRDEQQQVQAQHGEQQQQQGGVTQVRRHSRELQQAVMNGHEHSQHGHVQSGQHVDAHHHQQQDHHQQQQQGHHRQQQQGQQVHGDSEGTPTDQMSVPLLSHGSSMYQSMALGEQTSWLTTSTSAEHAQHTHHHSAPTVPTIPEPPFEYSQGDSCQAPEVDHESIPNAYLSVLQAAVPHKHQLDSSPGGRLAGVASEPGGAVTDKELTEQLVTEPSQTLDTMSIVSFESCRSVDSTSASPSSSLKTALQLGGLVGGGGEQGHGSGSPRLSAHLQGRSSRNLGRHSNTNISQTLHDGVSGRQGDPRVQHSSAPGAHPHQQPPQQPSATSAVLSKLPKWLGGAGQGHGNGAESAQTPFLPVQGGRSDDIAVPQLGVHPGMALHDGKLGAEGMAVDAAGPWLAIGGVDYGSGAGGAPVLLPAHIPVHLMNGQGSVVGVIPGTCLALQEAPLLARSAAGSLQAGTKAMHLIPDYVRMWLRGAGDALHASKPLPPNSSRQQLLDGMVELSTADVAAAYGERPTQDTHDAAVGLLEPHARAVRVPGAGREGGRRDGKSAVTMDNGMVGHHRAEQILAGHRRALSNVDLLAVSDAVHKTSPGYVEGSVAGQPAAKLPAGTYEVYVDSEDEEAGALLNRHARPMLPRYGFVRTWVRRLFCCF